MHSQAQEESRVREKRYRKKDVKRKENMKQSKRTET